MAFVSLIFVIFFVCWESNLKKMSTWFQIFFQYWQFFPSVLFPDVCSFFSGWGRLVDCLVQFVQIHVSCCCVVYLYGKGYTRVFTSIMGISYILLSVGRTRYGWFCTHVHTNMSTQENLLCDQNKNTHHIKLSTHLRRNILRKFSAKIEPSITWRIIC